LPIYLRAAMAGSSLIRDLDGDGLPDIVVNTYLAGLRVLPQFCW
jgi:hypothetical protein